MKRGLYYMYSCRSDRYYSLKVCSENIALVVATGKVTAPAFIGNCNDCVISTCSYSVMHTYNKYNTKSMSI